MKYETSYRFMIENEKGIWEDLIRGSTKLLTIFDKIDQSQYYVMKYINILFGLRISKDGFDELLTMVEYIYHQNNKEYYIDAYKMHKLIKHYLSDIDSSIDYMHKFLNELKLDDKDEKIIKFDRKNENFARVINENRNQVMHEGMATLSFREQRKQVVQHSDIGTYGYEEYTLTFIRFNINNNNDMLLEDFLKKTFNETQKKFQEITNLLLENYRMINSD